MAYNELALMESMTKEQRMLFLAQYGRTAKNRTTARRNSESARAV